MAERTRSEYLWRLAVPEAVFTDHDGLASAVQSARADETSPVGGDGDVLVRRVSPGDRERLATLLLEAYRGTIDDEGEGPDEARAAIDEYFSTMVHEHGYVLEQADDPVSFAFVVVVGGRHYIDPVVTAPSAKGRGLGSTAVRVCLSSLASVGVPEVGAVITDGNTASERLFAGLGFTRLGPWPPTPANR